MSAPGTVATSPRRRVDLGALEFGRGGHLLVKHALQDAPTGQLVEIVGTTEDLAVHVGAWCRIQGHGFERSDGACLVQRGELAHGRWRGAEPAGESGAPAGVADHPPNRWGLAARGARVEIGSPQFGFDIVDKHVVWADEAGRIYAQSVSAQWDPNTAVDWDAPFSLPDEIEDAVVQVMTYLIENETAALLVPARFLARIHPHFREVLQVLAVIAADEARHIEVFTRRATLKRAQPALSTAGGQASLKTLVDEPDFALASFMLSVLGEGSFLSLLWFLEANAPDPVTRRIAHLAARDEARHVAFGLAHLRRHASVDPGLIARLAAAVEHRHAQLQHTAGLNEEVFDALVLLAAGEWQPDAIGRGFDKVVELQGEMDRGRRGRLIKLGFDEAEAERVSALHTRNFM